MSSNTKRLLAAIPYLLILSLVVSVNLLGIYNYSFYGINVSVYGLLPYIIYVVIFSQSDDDFVKHHTIASLGTFFVYFTLVSLYTWMMHVLGYQVNTIEVAQLLEANSSTWIAIAPLLLIIIHALLSCARGVMLAYKLHFPDRHDVECDAPDSEG